MKTILFSAAIAALSLGLGATASFAQQADSPAGGHYEWRSVQQNGPRATVHTRKRVWIADSTQSGNCDCEMMKMSAHDCMKPMQSSGATPSAG